MIRRRRNGGEGHDSGRGRGHDNGHQPGAAPRVRGAWKTPAVVVRAPDGSVVEPSARPNRGPGGRVSKVQAAPTRRRIPPPGVTGGVLASPTRAVATKPPSSGARANGAASRQRANGVGSGAGAAAKPSRPRAATAKPSRRDAATSGTRRLVSGLRLDKLTRVDEEARERRNARLRWLGTRVGSLAVSVLLVYAVFPVRTYLSQRSDTNRARQQLEVLSEENDRLEQRAEELRDPETIEEIARRDHNLVMPGEESYGILPAPEQSPEGDTESG